MNKDFENCSEIEKKYISANAKIIEVTLTAFGLTTRIADLRITQEYYEYQLEIMMGTPIEEIEKHARDLALALASPTGKVNIIAPIPGRCLIGIRMPRPDKNILPALVRIDQQQLGTSKTWRDKIALVILAGSRLLENLSNKISTR